MLKFFVSGIKIIISVIMAFTSIFGIFTGDRQGKITRAESGCEASFAVISDTHLKNNPFRQGILELGLKDMERAKDKLDAVVFNGDITENSYEQMWGCFARAMSKYDVAKDTIMVIGNHDTRNHGDITGVTEIFARYNKIVSNRDIDKVYYSTKIGKYTAIILGSEGDNTDAYVSDEQIEWFRGEMAKASETGLPVFIFFHQSINGTHGLPYKWELDENDRPDRGGIGAASDTILGIIKQYKNVFYISGHIHEGFSVNAEKNGFTSVEKYDGYTLINVPCYMYPDFIRKGVISNGTGYVFEMYNDKVLIRARNFITGTWCTKYDVTVDIT